MMTYFLFELLLLKYAHNIDNSLGRNQTAGRYLKKHLSPGAKPPSWRA